MVLLLLSLSFMVQVKAFLSDKRKNLKSKKVYNPIMGTLVFPSWIPGNREAVAAGEDLWPLASLAALAKSALVLPLLARCL